MSVFALPAFVVPAAPGQAQTERPAGAAHPVRASADAAPLPPPGQSARPLNDPASWVTTQDYPAQALRDDHQGVVEFSLVIGLEGQVSECHIRSSSGSGALDEATCRLVRERARFAPAVDQNARPVVGHYLNRVRWVMPRPARPEAGELVMSFLVGPDGARSDCRIESAVGGAAQAVAGRNPCVPGSYASGYLDAAGKPVTRRVRTTVRYEVLPVP
ncbi:energy transducer TonB [Novosphingobium piscinae]